jgi:hypothetical protein
MRTTLLTVVGLLFAGLMPLPAQDAEAVLKLKNQIIDLQNKGTLAFKDFTLCSNVLGFGSYVPVEGPLVPRGGELLLYYEPVNVFTNRVKGQYEIWYTQDLALLSEQGEVLYDQKELLSFHYVSRSPVFDLYATNTLNLGDLPQGSYTLKAVLRDKQRQKTAEYALPFQIAD